MNNALFVTKELLRSLNVGAWGLSLLAVGAATLFLGALGLFTFLMQPLAEARVEAELLAFPQEQLSQAQLDELYQRLRSDPAIVRVRYVFAPPEEGAEGRFEITLRSDSDPSAVSARLQGWSDAFRAVRVPTPEPPGALRASIQDPQGRTIAIVAVAVLFGLSLLAVYAGLTAARTRFAPELELLELSGAAPQIMTLPFVLLGSLYGLTSAVLTALIFYYGGRALLELPEFLSLLPELIRPGGITTLALQSLFMGLLFGGVGGLMGLLCAQRYPKPLSRSRIAASSVSAGAKTPSSSEPLSR